MNVRIVKFTAFLLVFAFLICTVLCSCNNKYYFNRTEYYEMTDSAVPNPFMGFAPDAQDEKSVGNNALVYIDVTFKELQPLGPDNFDFESIEEENNIDLWKSRGQHAVLRFVCDKPGDELHTDIPDWLMELTGDGVYYETSYGKGYSPDYNNETFKKFHKNAINALAEYFDDGFASYVELGSLGHWGEWHINSEAGIGMPNEAVRDEYTSHYTEAFENAKLLMRRPFNAAEKNGLGLFNDMIGHTEATREWLDWIKSGGEYSQTDEDNALSSMPDFWKIAPSGGEFTSSVPMNEICSTRLDETIELLKESHTTFIGPKIPKVRGDSYDEIYRSASEKILSTIGYRLGITEVTVRQKSEGSNYEILLRWHNEGTAPLYFKLPVYLYTINAVGEPEIITEVDVDLTSVVPGLDVYSKTTVNSSLSGTLYLGIVDPMTNKPSVSLVSAQKHLGKLTEIYTFSD